jgi:O-antigen/teichoic acid export membrane protein
VLALAATAAVGAAQQHVLAIGLFAVSMNIGEFQRRLAFFRRRPIDVLWYDALRYGLILASFAAVSMSASSPTVLAYTSAMSASYLVTALVLPIARPDNETSISSLAVLWAQSRRLLRSGRWLVATNLMRLVNAQFVVFVAFFVLGAYETGLIRVAQTIVGVANPLIQGMEHVVPVALGRTIRERGVAMAIGQYRKLSLGLIAIFALLYGPLTVVSPFILRLFTVEADTQAILLVAGFSLGSLFNVLLTLVLFELRAREMTELSSVALFASGFLAIVIAYPAIEMLGLAGVVLTICITQALGIALLVTKALHRIKSRNVSKLNEQNALAP